MMLTIQHIKNNLMLRPEKFAKFELSVLVARDNCFAAKECLDPKKMDYVERVKLLDYWC